MADRSRKKLTPAQAARYGVSKIGGVGNVQKLFSIKSPWSVYKWMRDGIPPNRVLRFHAAVIAAGGELDLHDLRPEIYPARAA